MDIFENEKIKAVLKKLISNNSYVVFDILADNHLAIFYPLPYFELDVINKSLESSVETIQNINKYADMRLNWISLN